LGRKTSTALKKERDSPQEPKSKAEKGRKKDQGRYRGKPGTVNTSWLNTDNPKDRRKESKDSRRGRTKREAVCIENATSTTSYEITRWGKRQVQSTIKSLKPGPGGKEKNDNQQVQGEKKTAVVK